MALHSSESAYPIFDVLENRVLLSGASPDWAAVAAGTLTTMDLLVQLELATHEPGTASLLTTDLSGAGEWAGIEVSRPGQPDVVDSHNRLIVSPGSAIPASQRVLLRDAGHEIRETVITGVLTPMRIVETVSNAGTDDETVIWRGTMSPDGIVVKLADSFWAQDASGQQAWLTELDGLSLDENLGGGWVRLALGSGVRVETGLAELLSQVEVVTAEPDWIVHSSQLIPDDASFNQMWALNNTGQTGGTFDADIDAPEAWSITTGSSSVIVAVIDTGIDYTHPDLVANMWQNPGEIPGNGIDDDGNGYIDDIYGYDFANNDADPMDDHFHGTHVAGTIGAVGNNALGVTGVAWNVQLMAVKFLDADGYGQLSAAAASINYAWQNGARILNNSWGGGGYSSAIFDAIANANDAGALFVVAAGNESNNNDVQPTYPACYDLPNVVSVAATDHNDQLAGFSNYGLNTVDVAAPGVKILSTFPTAQTAAMINYSLAANYGTISGTSMATPQVAGAAALLLSVEPTLTPVQVRDRLMDRVDGNLSVSGKVASRGRINVHSLVDPNWTPPPAELFISGVTLDDSAGNGDGFAQSGERIGLTLSLVNVGRQISSGISLHLIVNDPYVTVLDGTESVSSLTPFQSVNLTNAFTLQLSPDAPLDHRVSVQIVAEDAAGDSTISEHAFFVSQVFEHADVEVNFDPSGFMPDPDRGLVYIVDQTNWRLLVVSLADQRTVRRIDLPGTPVQRTTRLTSPMAISPDGTRLFVSPAWCKNVFVYNLPDLTLRSVFQYDMAPADIAAGLNDRLYLSFTEDVDVFAPIYQVDASSGAILGSFNNGRDFASGPILRASQDGARLFSGVPAQMTVGGPGHISEFDISGPGLPVHVQEHPFTETYLRDFYVDEVNRRIYTMNGGIYAVQVTEMDTGVYGERWPLGDPYGGAVDMVPGSDIVIGASAAPYADADYVRYQAITGYNLGGQIMFDRTGYAPNTFAFVIDYGMIRTVGSDVVFGIKNRWTGDVTEHVNGYRYLIGATGLGDLSIEPLHPQIYLERSTSSGSLTMNFDAAYSTIEIGSIAQYRWDFGDGTTATGRQVSHTYGQAGDYTVTLTVVDNYGLVDSTAARVPLDGSPLVRMNFDGAYAADIIGWQKTSPITRWSDNRGYGWLSSTGISNSTGTNTSIPYISRSYVMALSDAVYWEYALPNGRYIVRAASGRMDYNGGHNLVVAEGQTLIDYVQTAADQLVTAAVEVVVTDGKLTVQLGDGSYSCLSWLTISLPEPGGPNPDTKPLAAMTVSTVSGKAPLAITFDGSKSFDHGGSIVSWNWDFGDSATAAGTTASHTYQKAGTYIATLTVTDNSGLTATVLQQIDVDPLSYQINFTVGAGPLPAGDWINALALPYTTTTGYGYINGTFSYVGGMDDGGTAIFLPAESRTYHSVSWSNIVYWEIPLPAGRYVVEVASGRTRWGNAHHYVAVEGVTVIDYVQIPANEIHVETQVIDITDGFLTMQLGRAGRSKPESDVNWLKVYEAPASVVGSYVFYNNSAWDGASPAGNAADDAAIAPDKSPLLPGHDAGFANYTSYTRGINGIMIDIDHLVDPTALTAADFVFRTGNTDDPATWADAPAPISVTVRQGAGANGSDRVTLIWADNDMDGQDEPLEAVAGKWLQVTVLANSRTGLPGNDVFYFGNAVGESGDTDANALVNATDVIGARDNVHGPFNRALIDDHYDYNRDRLVNAIDIIAARDNQTSPFTALRLITPVETAIAPLMIAISTDQNGDLVQDAGAGLLPAAQPLALGGIDSTAGNVLTGLTLTAIPTLGPVPMLPMIQSSPQAVPPLSLPSAKPLRDLAIEPADLLSRLAHRSNMLNLGLVGPGVKAMESKPRSLGHSMLSSLAATPLAATRVKLLALENTEAVDLLDLSRPPWLKRQSSRRI